MTKCTFLGAEYEPSDSVEMQGTYEKAQKYHKKGYYTKENRNGYWVLVKPSRVLVSIKTDETPDSINFKEEILDFYQRTRITQNLFEKFVDELTSGKIVICKSQHGNYTIE